MSLKDKLLSLWNDDAGSVIAAEYLALAGIVALGGVAGLAAVRNAVVSESKEMANSIQTINQSYRVEGQSACGASAGGSQAIDTPNICPAKTTP